jgi:LacI family transcriptional regulator
LEDEAVQAGRATIRTVARDAGVSVAAVSKVLRNAYGVSEALRMRVQASIERLGYRPSTAARAMRGRTYTVGVLVIDLHNPFVPEIIDGANAALMLSGYKALIGVGRSKIALESALVESMIDHNMDGLILIAPRLPREVIRRFAVTKPIVVIGHHFSDETIFDTVNSDDARGGELAVEELMARGYRDIGMLALSDRADPDVSTQRRIGYRRAMTAAGLADRIRVAEVGRSEADQLPALHRWLAAPDRPEAVVCWSDLTAVPLLGIAFEQGLRVPCDLAVVGYDNSSVAALPQVALSSIDQSGPELGARAAQVLLERVTGRREPRHLLVEPRLIRRGSTGGPIDPVEAGETG